MLPHCTASLHCLTALPHCTGPLHCLTVLPHCAASLHCLTALPHCAASLCCLTALVQVCGCRESRTLAGSMDYISTSETVAIDVMGFETIGDVEPGQVMIVVYL